MLLNQNALLSLNVGAKGRVVNDVATLNGYELDKLFTQNTYESCRIPVSEIYTTPIVLKVVIPKKEPLRIVSLVKTNLSQLSQWKVVVKDREDGITLHDSGYMNVFTAIDGYGTEDWGSFNWGGLGPEANYTGLSVNASYPLPEELYSGYVEISVLMNDLTKLYFESFLLWLGNGFQPDVNADYGAEIEVIDDTEVKASRAGNRTYGSPIKRRQISIDLSGIHKTEFFKKLFGPIMQETGKSTLIQVVLTPDDLDSRMFQSLVGNITNDSKATHAFWNRLDVTLNFEESP